MNLRPKRAMLAAILGAIAPLVAGVTLADTASAETAIATSTTHARFWHESVLAGARDADPNHISHVYELQWRLRRLGLFHVTPTGYFGSITGAAVKAAQLRYHLPQSGTVGPRTWYAILTHSMLASARVPSWAKSSARGIAYVRDTHEVFVYRTGVLWNTWLVRGGAATTPTRTGSFRVFYKNPKLFSRAYQSWMYHYQGFSGSEGFHGSPLMVNPYSGHSHGCVNMYREDAQLLWELTSGYYARVSVLGPWA